MKKSIKKAFLIIAGVVLCISVLSGIYIYRDIHMTEQIDYMESKEDTPKLVRIFTNRWNPIMVRQAALEQLSVIDSAPAAVEPLVKVLQSGWQFPDFRGEVAFTLGCIGDERAIGPLIKALDYGPEIKEAALQGLSFIEVRDKRVAIVARKLLNDESEVIRDLAIIALGVHGGEEDLDLLMGQLKNGDWGERANAADALGKIGDKRAVNPLIERLAHDTDNGVIRACCVALGKIEDERAVDVLIKTLRGTAYVQAAIALGQIGDNRAVQPIVKELKKLHHNEDGRNKLKEVYKMLTGDEYQESL